MTGLTQGAAFNRGLAGGVTTGLNPGVRAMNNVQVGAPRSFLNPQMTA